MSEQQPSPGPSQASSRSSIRPGSHSNYTETQRAWMFGLLFRARTLMGRDIEDTSRAVCERTVELVMENSQLTRFSNPPTARTIYNLWKSFKSSGKVAKVTKTAGRKVTKHLAEIEYLAKETHGSTREIANLISQTPGDYVSKTTVQKHLKKTFGMRFYLTPKGQLLKDSDAQRRLDFAHNMLYRLSHREIDINNILFTDECIIGTGPSSNRKNDGYYLVRGEPNVAERLKEMKFHGEKCHMFIGLHSKLGHVGPYYIDELPEPNSARVNNLTGPKYNYLLQHHLIPDLKRLLGDDFNTCWFMQDGAPPHTTKQNLDLLHQEFNYRLISNKTSFIWPPYSPDLNPCDFFYWSRIRRGIGFDLPSNREEIKMSAHRVALETRSEMIQRAINDLKIRCEAVIHHQGYHFETEYHKFKRLWKSLKPPCPSCNQRHHCGCPACKRRCENPDDDRSSISSLDPQEHLEDDDFEFSDPEDTDPLYPLEGAMGQEEWPDE